MAAKSQGRNWVPGLFAAFWILLAAFSSAYLFRIITGPQANRADSASARTAATSASTEPVAASPPRAAAMSADQAEGLVQSNEAKDKEINELKATVRDLSGQVTELNNRLKPLEKVLGPVAALPSSTAVTTSPPSPEAMKPTERPSPPPPPAPVKPAERPSPPPTPAVTVDEPPEDQKPEVSAKPAEKPEAEAGAKPSDNVSSPRGAEASGMESEPATSGESRSGKPDETQTANLSPAASISPGTTKFGIEIGSVGKQDEIRPLWKSLQTNHAALVAGLQARRVMAPDKKWRLIAGPFSSAAEATQACGLFKKASMPCAATVFAGDAF